MIDFSTVEPAIDPANKISFLLDWELTMKCNLDCSYCLTGIDGGHDNSRPHPKKEDCFKTIDFMFEYADIYMSKKVKSIKYVILNVYGGESLHHPDIVEILQRCRQRYNETYADRWHLTITTTTNAIVSEKKLKEIIPLIDEFTVSYHSENNEKQKNQFKQNLLTIKNSGQRLKCVVLMHTQSELFQDALQMQEWLEDNQIKMLPRQLDGGDNYQPETVIWFDKLYTKKQYNKEQKIDFVLNENGSYNLTETGRGCCGGRQMHIDKDYKGRIYYVKNNFTDWYCSVNEFFVYIKQVNGEIFVNKDCRMNFQGEVGSIGNLSKSQDLLDSTRQLLNRENPYVIKCKKSRCYCGICAPKSKDLNEFNSIMKKYHI